ncbi:MAG: hypothetical protein ACK4NE_03495 [Albidovulum sp.]
MALNDHPISGALARAAERWQRALLIAGKTQLPQLADLATRREAEARPDRVMPSPFRPRRA